MTIHISCISLLVYLIITKNFKQKANQNASMFLERRERTWCSQGASICGLIKHLEGQIFVASPCLFFQSPDCLPLPIDSPHISSFLNPLPQKSKYLLNPSPFLLCSPPLSKPLSTSYPRKHFPALTRVLQEPGDWLFHCHFPTAIHSLIFLPVALNF